MKYLMKHFIIFCILLIIPNVVFAQTSITSSDVMSLLGGSQSVELDTTGNMAINVGSSGANQIWDLTSVAVQGYMAEVSYQMPQNTPLQMYFPSANFVYSLKDTSGSEGYDEIIYYNYVDVASTYYSSMGGGIEIPELDTSFVLYMSDDVAPLPLVFNSTWISTESDTVGDPAIFAEISLDTITNIIDGWGIMQLPIGTFNCLRVRADNKYTQLTVIGGQIQSINITRTITYSWVSKDNFILAEAESQDNDTNPNFTTASEFQWLTSIITGMKMNPKSAQNPNHFELFQNYPNPFNPTTTIKYRLPHNTNVELSVYSPDGRLIATLVDKFQVEGEYSIEWDALDVSSGVYFFQINAGEFSAVKKGMLLK